MDLNQYDKLRKKINTKDFEGNNKALDKWLYLFSFVGNFGSIFFSYFLVFPALYKAISINIVEGIWATILAFLFANIFLIIFEIIKRYLIRSFSSDFVVNKKKLKIGVAGWLVTSIAIIFLSFYLSIIGSKNLASISSYKDNIVEMKTTTMTDSLLIKYESKKKTYEIDNESLRIINNNLRQKLTETPIEYLTVRNNYQANIDKNVKIIQDNSNEINKIDEKLNKNVANLKSDLVQAKTINKTEDIQNIILFIIIACFCEIIIFVGIYFREWFEYNLFNINQQKFEKIYTKRDRYRSLLTFIYNDGKLGVGSKVMSGLELKELVFEKTTTIENPKKMIDVFLHDMDKLGVFSTTGKRRHIALPFNEAINVVNNLDDIFSIIENMK